MNRVLATLTGLVAAFHLALAATPARATTVIEKSLADLCQEADVVFVGEVVKVEPRWRDEKQKAIETVVTFDVLEALYGNPSGEVKLHFSGGEMDGMREVVAGMPQFRTGEEVMVFATDQPSVSPIVGFHQGCFRIVDAGQGRVVLNAEEQPVTGVRGRSLFFGKAEDGPRGAMPLAEFIDVVRQQLGQRGKDSP